MATITSGRASAVARLLSASFTGDTGTLGDIVTDDVCGWSPNLLVTSRKELLDAVDEREDAFTNPDVTIDAVNVFGDKAAAEWHAAVDFTGPLELEPDVVVEPTGVRLEMAGATFAEFDGDRIRVFRHYYDDLALLEQLLGGM